MSFDVRQPSTQLDTAVKRQSSWWEGADVRADGSEGSVKLECFSATNFGFCMP